MNNVRLVTRDRNSQSRVSIYSVQQSIEVIDSIVKYNDTVQFASIVIKNNSCPLKRSLFGNTSLVAERNNATLLLFLRHFLLYIRVRSF